MVDRLNPGFSDDPEDYTPDEVQTALEERNTSFRKRRRDFFTDEGTTPPPEDPDDPRAESPFTMEVSGTQRQAVERVHQDRSEKAQIADESFNSRTTTDTSKWAAAPDRFDYPGVDTVAPTIQRDRAEELAEFAEDEGVVKDITVQENIEMEGLGSVAGRAQYRSDGNAAVQLREDVAADEQTDDPRFDFSPVLTHEVGHAIDFAGGFSFSDMLEREGNEELRDEAVTISETMRGVFDDASDARTEYRSGQGEGSRELVADFVASQTLQPRATERIAPELSEKFEERFEQTFGTDFGDAVR
jgi:hypothetical protein